MATLTAQLRREARLTLRSRAEVVNPLAFYVLAALLLSIGLGKAGASPGMIWALTLFANMLAGAELFRRDQDDGTLELLLLHSAPRYAAVLAKLAVHWLAVGLPVALVGPLAFLLLGGEGAGRLAISLLLGAPALCCIGAVGAALTVSIGGRGLLFAVLVLPLYLPVFIFGVAGAAGEQPAFALPMLAAWSVALTTAAPFAIGQALAISQEY